MQAPEQPGSPQRSTAEGGETAGYEDYEDYEEICPYRGEPQCENTCTTGAMAEPFAAGQAAYEALDAAQEAARRTAECPYAAGDPRKTAWEAGFGDAEDECYFDFRQGRVPADPLFEISGAGILRLDPRWAARVEAFCAAVDEEAGANPQVSWWLYREGGGKWVVFDVRGDAGEVNVTIRDGKEIEIPAAAVWAEFGRCEPVVTDLVDALYLVSMLLESLGLKLACLGPGLLTEPNGA